MIYLDVTGSCKSGKNTGVQRTTRRVFSELSKRTPVTPICWDTIGDRYQFLGGRERQILESPFTSLPTSTRRPDLYGENFASELKRFLFRRAVPLTDDLQPGDTLLVPDIFRDGRLQALPALFDAHAIKSVAIFHDAALLRLPRGQTSNTERFADYIRTLACFDRVVSVSEASRADLLELWAADGIPPAATCVEPWPTDFDGKVRGEQPRGKRLVVACIGSLEPRKNHHRLLSAAESLWESGHDFELELIGRSVRYSRRVLADVRRLRRRGFPVAWLRHVDDEQLHSAYRRSAFTVYPSLMEGFGLPIRESLWHGKPCVCGGNGALGEVAAGGGCLVIDQRDVRALAEAMERMLVDHHAYAELAAQAAARRFRSWEAYTDNLIAHLLPEPLSFATEASSRLPVAVGS